MADLVVFGDVLTMDDANPRATAVAVEDGRIVAVGADADVAGFIGPRTVVHDVGNACIMPGFIEAHGHPLNEAVLLGEPVVDIRPVTVPDADGVLATIAQAVADAGPEGAVLNGWDPLLQKGLDEPTLQWMNEQSPHKPLIVLHNSGHAAYFNSTAAAAAGVTEDTPDPEGARFGRDADTGELTGVAYESAAVIAIAGPVLASAAGRFPDLLAAESARLNAAGVTTVSEMAFDPGAGDEMVRQVGIKIWSDGSPWIGNIALSFAYLDTPATRALGMACSHGGANYTGEQILEISTPYYEQGWQIACHAHGDDAITMVLDAWEQMLSANPRDDHRLRLEHVGAMRPDQFRRAADLGVTCSLFVDHLYYWGDVLVDDLFGSEHGGHWAAAGSALAAGHRISFHNDGPVTPTDPLRNLADSVTRRSRGGRVLAPEERIPVEAALRAQTVDAAWQLFSEDSIGALKPGMHADLVVLSANPLAVDPERIADIEVRATVFAGATVYGSLS
ncbi:amidohydrolase family protein [Rhodococcus hoagii]|uniref:amidohydrolase n=1 Tax=Prescottella sp. D32 TaxID=3029740 RepID=UPI001A0590FD|nr:amidohydrolase family protein [Prescottella equi]NKR47864.1 amidohydrolase family protein [Prescottella equi]NKR50566.1 amidohydrolase family protein [Prescottella equi]NKR64021.1 amidohydrolase family protein [Prescottella equi]NKR79875.1 amidohydrolase family protein [Prescottella equi]